MSFGIPVRNGLSIGIGTLVSLTSGSGVGGRSRRPALYFDFLTTTSLDSRITFSRTTQATLVDATGRVTYAPNNLLTNSESFEAASWVKTEASIAANSTVSPNGTVDADTLVESTANAGHNLRGTATLAATTAYTYSFYAKAAGRSNISVTRFNSAVVPSFTHFFDLSAGTASGGGAITNAGNGWYRCSGSVTTIGAGSGGFVINLLDATLNTTYTGDGTSGVFLWGAQLEAVTYQTTPGAYNSTTPQNLLGFTQEFDNAAWTKSNAFVQTNLLTWSEQFDNAAWVKSSVTITANATTAPDGTNTADRVQATAAASVTQDAVVNATSATYTIYAKQGSGATEGSRFLLRNATTATNLIGILLDYSTGGITYTVGSSGASATDVGNGWWRISLTATTGITSGNQLSCYVGFTGGGSAGQFMFAWGAQLVQGATAGDYQPTTAAAAPVQYAAPDGTRSAEALQETTATGLHLAQQFFTFASGVPYTVSAYVKAGSRTWVQLLLPGAAFTASQGGFFNLTGDGSLGTATGTPTARSITAVGNGWYRISVTATATASAGGNIPIVAASADGTTSYAGSDTSPALFLWGAQLSNSASLDPYVYNPAAAPTSAAYYGPRFDYNPVTLAPRGLLIEEQRTNRTLQSEDFTAATWVATVVGTSTRVNDGAPLGFTRGLITATSATGGIRQIHTGLTSGQVYALSFYIQSTATSVQIVFENGTAQFGSSHNVTINPSNGTAGVLTGFTSVSIQPFGPGYVYTLITAPAGGALAANIEWRITNSGNSIWLGRPQFEAGAFATSYIPTVASQVTRTADVASMLGANFSNWYNQTEGTFVASGSSFGGAVSGLYEASASGAAAQSISVRLGQRFSFAQNLNRFDFSYTTGNTINHAFAYSASNYGAAVGGTNLTVNANGQPTSVPAGANQLALGYLGSSTFQLNGYLRSLGYYPTRLTDAQLQAITV